MEGRRCLVSLNSAEMPQIALRQRETCVEDAWCVTCEARNVTRDTKCVMTLFPTSIITMLQDKITIMSKLRVK